MGKKYLVADYMHTPVFTVIVTATLKQAVETMIRNHTNGLVVVDGKGKVAGILSSMDIIEYIVPDYLEKDLHLASFESGDLFEERIRELQDHQVTEFMTKKVHTIKPNHCLMEASALLSEHAIRQLPVVDESGNLIGYLNRTDIKRAIGQILGFLSNKG